MTDLPPGTVSMENAKTIDQHYLFDAVKVI
jgi:hypothetical protein